MNVKRYIGATLALFAYIFFYEWIVHGNLLSPYYQQTSEVWRSMDEMQAQMPFAMLFQLAFSAWTAFIFTRLYREGGVANGLQFGLYIGGFLGLLTANWYLFLPIPTTLGWAWLLTGFGKGLGGGLVLGAIYHRSKQTQRA